MVNVIITTGGYIYTEKISVFVTWRRHIIYLNIEHVEGNFNAGDNI